MSTLSGEPHIGNSCITYMQIYYRLINICDYIPISLTRLRINGKVMKLQKYITEIKEI